MSTSEIIEHPGVVLTVHDNNLEVRILAQSACAASHAKGACSAADMEEKIVIVRKSLNDVYQIGQQVTVLMKRELGTLAVFFGYIFPFLVMLITLIVFIVNGFGEGTAGLVAIGVLVPYYLVLYLMRDRLNDKFVFAVKPFQVESGI